MKTPIQYPKSAGMPASHLPFSPAIRVGDLIFISGQASVDATGKIIPDTFEGEMRRSIDNLKKAVEGAGSDLRHVVQTRNYVRDPANIARYNELYREYFSGAVSHAHDHHQLPAPLAAVRGRVHRGRARVITKRRGPGIWGLSAGESPRIAPAWRRQTQTLC